MMLGQRLNKLCNDIFAVKSFFICLFFSSLASADMSASFNEGVDAGYLMICMEAYPESPDFKVWEEQSIILRSKYEADRYDEKFTLGLMEVGDKIKPLVESGEFNHNFCSSVSARYYQLISN
jgi:hypothetical protein